MNIYVGQIYVEAGASYPFSIKWQEYLGKKLTDVAGSSAFFEEKYGKGHSLIIRISAKAGSNSVEVRGPTHFRRDKHVEYTVFLPHRGARIIRRSDCRGAMTDVVAGIKEVFELVGLQTEGLRDGEHAWTEEILSRADMFEHVFM